MTDRAANARTDETVRIPKVDLDNARARLELVRHLAALVNSGGGTVVVGARSNGSVVGLDADAAARFVDAALSDTLSGFLRPDRVVVTAARVDNGGDRWTVELSVAGHPEPPVVMAQAGVVRGDDGEDDVAEVFGAGDVYVRRNGRTERARREDHVRWRGDAVGALRRELRERLSLVIDAPAGATVRVVTDDEVRDEPSYFLSRSAELFRLQPEQLLSTGDLVYLWLRRSTLSFDDDATRLLVHSALRKRATLYLWLTVLPVSTEQIRTYLFEAVDMRDRDKSDAARAVLLVCALYLEADDYERLAAALQASSYVHMREAVKMLPDIESARSQLHGERAISSGQEQLLSEPDIELFAQVDALLAKDGATPRRVPSYGLELLNRKLDRQRDDAESVAEVAETPSSPDSGDDDT